MQVCFKSCIIIGSNRVSYMYFVLTKNNQYVITSGSITKPHLVLHFITRLELFMFKGKQIFEL